LAGLTLGISLRRQDIPVTIWEAGHYPRHRVCGEFISGRGLGSLERLGLKDALLNAGAWPSTTVAFFVGAKRTLPRTLPTAALSISRFVLDEVLATEFRRLGGELRSGGRWTGEFGEGVVRASGRRIQPVTQGWRLFGLKTHAAGLDLNADLEMHFVRAGYVGLCRLPNGEVNICGLFRTAGPVADLSQRWREWLSGETGSVLHSRLAQAHLIDGSFCSVAGLCLRPRRAQDLEECCVGDALTMIPPVTGNGMSMAFESAELALAPLLRFSQGLVSWDQARQEVARRCDRQFVSRLRSAATLQRILFHPWGRSMLLFLVTRSWNIWRGLFDATR
jgi:2-polyprenyl-6-methoxyphenol hydroxylase-like FAD-dependent oxidoreductase